MPPQKTRINPPFLNQKMFPPKTPRLLLGADPNSFIREGNTALLALVGADPTQPAAAELEIFQVTLAAKMHTKIHDRFKEI